MNKKVMEVIHDFNRLCDFEIVYQEGKMLCIKDLQLWEISEPQNLFVIEIIDWLERIYTYYIDEVPNEINFRFNLYDYKELKDYYNKVLEVIDCIEEVRGSNA
jgi:hypothetical protein